MARPSQGGFRLRPLIFWPHLIVGVAAGIVIFIMSITGVLLTYQRQMLLWAERGYRAAPAAGVERLPMATLVDNVTRAYQAPNPAPPPPGARAGGAGAATGVTTITLRNSSEMPVQMAINGKTVSVNPYTGSVLGEGAVGMRNFFRSVTNWHRWLAVEGEGRTTARAITGASNLIFVFLAVSGLYLWWPRKWNVAAVRNITVFRRNLPAKARDFNWHHVFGFWMAIPIAILAGTGVVMSYPWANNLVYTLAGEQPPAAQAAPAPNAGGGEGRGGNAARAEQPRVESTSAQPERVSVDSLIATAASREPDWTILSFRWQTNAAPVAFTIDRGTGGQPHLKSTLTLNARTGGVDKYEFFAEQTRGRRWRTWTRWLHTGEAGGLSGQTLAGIASFAGVMLVYSGFALSWRRFVDWSRRRKRTSNSDSSSPNRSQVA